MSWTFLLIQFYISSVLWDRNVTPIVTGQKALFLIGGEEERQIGDRCRWTAPLCYINSTWTWIQFICLKTERLAGYTDVCISDDEDDILQTLIRGVRHSCVGKDRQIGEIGQTNRQIGNQGKQIVFSSTDHCNYGWACKSKCMKSLSDKEIE